MKSNKSIWIILASLAIVLAASIFYISAHRSGTVQADPSTPANSDDTSTTPVPPIKKDAVTKQPATIKTDTETKTTSPTLGDQTPWMHGPSDQAPASIGTGINTGVTLDPSLVPWAQGPSDQ